MNQNKNGNAFEYACLSASENCFKQYQHVVLVQDTHYQRTFEDFKALTIDRRELLLHAANRGIESMIRFEPNLSTASQNPIRIKLNQSRAGQDGDVRDIIFEKPESNWQIGISSKHNHDAVKHSRLSSRIDFGMKWMNVPTPQSYFTNLAPLWDSLQNMKNQKLLWSEVPHKEDMYERVIGEFVAALNLLAENKSNYRLAENFLKYLLGRHDFYKLIVNTTERTTSLQVMNLHGTLQAANQYGVTSLTTVSVPIPRDFILIKQETYNRLTVILDKYWTIGMRIHSASSRVENSFKLDIRLDGIPANLPNIVSPW